MIHSCKDMAEWEEQFKDTVDDLIFHSNVHDCRTSVAADEKKQKKERRGCLNKNGQCKARFPREIYKETQVDPKTGALNIKKGEKWINTYTPVLTYLMRCNTDVTSLLSGTAIKAIVAYVSDYITKVGLKTYSIFDAIRSVIDRNSEMLGGDSARKEKARSVLTQIVNNLTAKMEIGAPMACLYLLGNPDHYTNHKFVVFYWKSYVSEVLKSWRTDENMEKDKVVLLKTKGGEYIGLSSIDDYKFRPYQFENKSLYEWIQISKRVKRSDSEKEAFLNQRHDISDGEDELDVMFKSPEPQIFKSKKSSQKYKHISEDKDESEDELNIKDLFVESELEEEEFEISENHFAFQEEHPLYETHYIEINETAKIVPNFAGGSLPRCDHGDREYYCATMLTLFKPWRSGKDLKNEDYSWDETFSSYAFTDRQLQLMKFFNIRYECNDARDDYSQQMKKGNKVGGVFPQWFSSEMMEEMDNDTDVDEGADFQTFNDQDPSNYIKYIQPGKKGLNRAHQMQEIQEKVKAAGWLDKSPDGLPQVNTTTIQPDQDMSGANWKAAI